MSRESEIKAKLMALIPSITETGTEIKYRLGQIHRTIPKQYNKVTSTRTGTFF
jgi:hypothetical protein